MPASSASAARPSAARSRAFRRWRERYRHFGPDALLDAPRPGAPRTVLDADVERIVQLTLETLPENATQWSTRAMARASGSSQTTVSRVWRALALRPHLTESFKLPADPLFVEKVRDIVGLYLAPPDRALVLCVDEKPQIQALERDGAVIPMQPGQARTRAIRRWSGELTITCGTGRPPCSRRWTPRRVR